ncbi:hypothetical protein DRP04_13780, partial [Archaeoglobales archaeon]
PSSYFKSFYEREALKLSFFEKMCKFSRRLKLRCPSFIRKKLHDAIFLTELKVTEDEVFSFAVLSFLVSLFPFLLIALMDFPSTAIFLIFPPFIAYNVLTYPLFYSEVIRIRAGNETVGIILYMVTYLSLNPVYDLAVAFAASRCHGPLGRDFKKVVWEVKAGKYPTMREALAAYTKKWNLWNEDFVKALSILQLVELQPTQQERNEVLRTATEKIMRSTYIKMEKYAFGLKTPSLLLMLFGIMLPLMILVMFPIISIFLAARINPIYLAIGFDVLLPFFIWWFLYKMISKRPATYSHSEKIEEVLPRKHLKIGKLKIPIIPVALLIGLLIASPGIYYYLQLYAYYRIIHSKYPKGVAEDKWAEFCLSRYEPDQMLRDTFHAMFCIWGISAGIIFATYFRTKGPYQYDLYIRKLEKDFQDGLFELQAALKQNIPLETAVVKVVEEFERLNKGNSPIALFFKELHKKLTRSITTLEDVLFGREGLVTDLPSSLIKNIMEIVVGALRRGPIIASEIIRNIVSYLSRIREIEHLINKSLVEVVSNLKMQAQFITPFISAIIASSAVIIIQLLQAIARAIQRIESIFNIGTNVGGILSNAFQTLFQIKRVMPPTVMQLIVGVYSVEVILITAIFLTGIARGFNKVYRDYYIWRFLLTSTFLFSLLFFGMVVTFQGLVLKQMG